MITFKNDLVNKNKYIKKPSKNIYVVLEANKTKKTTLSINA